MAKFTKLNIGDSVASSGGRVWKKLSAESAVDDSIVGTWFINETIAVPTSFTSSVTGSFYGFSYSGDVISMAFSEITSTVNASIKIYDEYGIAYNIYYLDGSMRCRDDGDESSYNVSVGDSRMAQLRQITITEEPTDEAFITWLKANATKTA